MVIVIAISVTLIVLTPETTIIGLTLFNYLGDSVVPIPFDLILHFAL